MHICYLTDEYPMIGQTQGGIGSVVETIAQALVRKGIDVSVVGIRTNLEEVVYEEYQGVRVWNLPASKWPIARFLSNSKRLAKKLAEINRENPIDILEGSELSFAFIPSSFPPKKVIRMHGGHHFFSITLGKKPEPWRSYQERRSFSKADALVAVSTFVGHKTEELLGFFKPFRTIYNIVDIDKFYPTDLKKVIPGKILFVGTVTEKKGVRQLVQAMPKILEAYPQATLDIVGRDWRDPQTGRSYIGYLKSVITDDIRKAIKFVGPLNHDEIPRRLEEAEVCVYPSHMEAMPIAWLEALAMGKPVVASKLGPGPEVVKERVTGLLCNPLDPLDIADKVIEMFSCPDKSVQMGQNARKDILSRFNPNRIISQNIDFYKSLL